MKPIWNDQVVIAGVGATYGTAVRLNTMPIYGDVRRMSVTRIGANNGTVTVEVSANESFTDILMEVEFQDLNGANASNVWGCGYKPTFNAPDGLYVRAMDTADAGDSISVKISGETGEGVGQYRGIGR